MSLKELSCAFTGHRPTRFSFGYDEENEKCLRFKLVIAGQIKKLIECGVTTFYCGMALGVDQWAFEIVVDFKREYPHARLVAVRPCDSQANKRSVEQRERYFDMLPSCDEEVLISYEYTPTCMFERSTTQVTMQEERTEQLLEFCAVPRSRDEMQQFIGIANREHFRKAILKPLLYAGKLKMTIPEKPNSRNQKYVCN